MTENLEQNSLPITRSFFRWLPVAGWCALIFYFSSIPNLGTGWGLYDFVLRKIAHLAEYGILAVLVWRAWGLKAHPKSYVLTLWFCIFYAISDEWHQGFVPGRDPSLWDVAIDSTGALCVCLAQRRLGQDLFSWGWRWIRGSVS